MTREQTIEAIRVMQAYVDGKEVQTMYDEKWQTTNINSWNWFDCNYRIKPTAKLRPWTADEVPLGRGCGTKERCMTEASSHGHQTKLTEICGLRNANTAPTAVKRGSRVGSWRRRNEPRLSRSNSRIELATRKHILVSTNATLSSSGGSTDQFTRLLRSGHHAGTNVQPMSGR